MLNKANSVVYVGGVKHSDVKSWSRQLSAITQKEGVVCARVFMEHTADDFQRYVSALPPEDQVLVSDYWADAYDIMGMLAAPQLEQPYVEDHTHISQGQYTALRTRLSMYKQLQLLNLDWTDMRQAKQMVINLQGQARKHFGSMLASTCQGLSSSHSNIETYVLTVNRAVWQVLRDNVEVYYICGAPELKLGGGVMFGLGTFVEGAVILGGIGLVTVATNLPLLNSLKHMYRAVGTGSRAINRVRTSLDNFNIPVILTALTTGMAAATAATLFLRARTVTDYLLAFYHALAATGVPSFLCDLLVPQMNSETTSVRPPPPPAAPVMPPYTPPPQYHVNQNTTWRDRLANFIQPARVARTPEMSELGYVVPPYDYTRRVDMEIALTDAGERPDNGDDPMAPPRGLVPVHPMVHNLAPTVFAPEANEPTLPEVDHRRLGATRSLMRPPVDPTHGLPATSLNSYDRARYDVARRYQRQVETTDYGYVPRPTPPEEDDVASDGAPDTPVTDDGEELEGAVGGVMHAGEKPSDTTPMVSFLTALLTILGTLLSEAFGFKSIEKFLKMSTLTGFNDICRTNINAAMSWASSYVVDFILWCSAGQTNSFVQQLANSQVASAEARQAALDIPVWIEESDRLLGRVDSNADAASDPDLHAQGKDLQARGGVILSRISGASPGWSVKAEITRRQARLMVFITACEKAQTTRVRAEPVVMYICGGSGVGKTTLVAHLIRKLAQAIPTEEFAKRFNECTLRYNYNSELDHWDGYANQPILVWDDVFRYHNEPKGDKDDCAQLISLINSDPYNLKMAAIDNKGHTYFNSKFMALTSNFGFPAPAGDTNAICRRLHLHVLAIPNDGASYQPDFGHLSLYVCTQFRDFNNGAYNEPFSAEHEIPYTRAELDVWPHRSHYAPVTIDQLVQLWMNGAVLAHKRFVNANAPLGTNRNPLSPIIPDAVPYGMSSQPVPLTALTKPAKVGNPVLSPTRQREVERLSKEKLQKLQTQRLEAAMRQPRMHGVEDLRRRITPEGQRIAELDRQRAPSVPIQTKTIVPFITDLDNLDIAKLGEMAYRNNGVEFLKIVGETDPRLWATMQERTVCAMQQDEPRIRANHWFHLACIYHDYVVSLDERFSVPNLVLHSLQERIRVHNETQEERPIVMGTATMVRPGYYRCNGNLCRFTPDHIVVMGSEVTRHVKWADLTREDVAREGYYEGLLLFFKDQRISVDNNVVLSRWISESEALKWNAVLSHIAYGTCDQTRWYHRVLRLMPNWLQNLSNAGKVLVGVASSILLIGLVGAIYAGVRYAIGLFGGVNGNLFAGKYNPKYTHMNNYELYEYYTDNMGYIGSEVNALKEEFAARGIDPEEYDQREEQKQRDKGRNRNKHKFNFNRNKMRGAMAEFFDQETDQINSLLTNINTNLYEIEYLPAGYKMKALQLEGGVFLVNKHLIPASDHNEAIFPFRLTQSKRGIFDGVSFTEQVERCNITFPEQAQLTDAGCQDYMLVEFRNAPVHKSLRRHIAVGVVEDKTQPQLCAAKHVSGVLMVQEGTLVSTSKQTGTNNDGKTCTATVYCMENIASRKGDCGTPLLTVENGQMRICGLLSMGLHDGSTAFQVLTKANIDKMLDRHGNKSTAKMLAESKWIVPDEEAQPVSMANTGKGFELKHIQIVGRLHQDNYDLQRLPQSDIARSPFYGKVEDWEPGKYAPAAITKAALKKAVEKKDKPVGNMRPFERRLAINWVTQRFHTYVGSGLRVKPNWHAALNGTVEGEKRLSTSLEMDASPGIPLVLQRPKGVGGREFLFDKQDGAWVMGPALKEEVETSWNNWKQQIANPHIFKDQLKVEKRDADRVVEQKTRLYSAAPVQKTICDRRALLPFYENYMKNRNELHHALGIDAQGPEWDTLARRHVAFGEEKRHACIDFSSFDATVCPSLMTAAYECIANCYDYNDRKYIYCSMEESMHNFSYTGGVIYRNTQGVPSGLFHTSMIDCVINTVLFVYAYICECREHFKELPSMEAFYDNFYYTSYGDDVVYSVKKKLQWLTPEKLCAHMNAMGMEAVSAGNGVTKTTNALEGFIPWREVTFLKRSFVRNGRRIDGLPPGVFVGPLPVEIIEESVMWCHAKADDEDIRCTVRNALLQANIVGTAYMREFAQRLRNVPNQRCKNIMAGIDTTEVEVTLFRLWS